MEREASEIKDQVSKLVDDLKIPNTWKDKLKIVLFGDVFELLEDLVDKSRPPVFYLVGRSGHGKSSVINALAGKRVADVGDVKPTTAASEKYLITFREEVSWEVVDSRGLFESTTPEGALPADTIELVEKDIKGYKPDVVLHVVSSPEIRSFSFDLKIFSGLMETAEVDQGVKPVVLMVLTKVDVLGNPCEWPPEKHPKKAALIKESLCYVGEKILRIPYEPIYKSLPYKGLYLKDTSYFATIPVCVVQDEEEQWNVDTLAYIMAEKLPMSAVMNYVRAKRREKVLRAVAKRIVDTIARLAGIVGMEPIPISDIAVLIPLQLVMIATIGYLAGKPLSLSTAEEYLAAAGLTLGAGYSAREVARQLLKFIPIVGDIVSGVVAGGWTYALGRGAIEYFFSGKAVDVQQFKNKWEQKPSLLQEE